MPGAQPSRVPTDSSTPSAPSEPHTPSESDDKTDRYYLPLLEVSMDVKVIGTTSRTTLTQTFTNLSSVTIPTATYCFPLYDDSIVVAFRAWIGEHTLLEGTVKPKDEAKKEFKDAVRRQKAAVLLEEVTPEVFETSLGNLPPHTAVKIEVEYINELKPDISGHGVLVTIPTSVAPRYGSAPISTSNSGINTSENGLKIQVEVSSSVPIRKLESRTHPISCEMGESSGPTIVDSFAAFAAAASSISSSYSKYDPTKAIARLSDRSTTLGRDFTLVILASSDDMLASRALLEQNPNTPDTAALQVNFCPGQLFKAEEATDDIASEIIFLSDRSGSMSDKMDALKSALRIFIKSIPRKCLFNIHSFGSTYSTLWETSQPYEQAAVDRALAHINKEFASDMGGTELLSALQQAVKSRTAREGVSIGTEIILLTDGEVWNTEETISFVRHTRETTKGMVRFFALGIGDQVSHRLVEGIGRHGGGFAEVVAVHATGKWESEVIRMLKGALTPSQWEVQLDLPQALGDAKPTSLDPHFLPSQLPVARPGVIQAPFKVPSLHAFVRTSVYFFVNPQHLAIANGNPEITITGNATSSGSSSSFTASIPLTTVSTPTLSIHYLAAKALMSDLESGTSWLHATEHAGYRSRDEAGFQKHVVREAQEIGTKYNIAGKWTSFVAVDRGDDKEFMSETYRAERSELADLTRTRETSYGMTGRYRPPKMSLGSFLKDESLGSWADEVEEVASPKQGIHRYQSGYSSVTRNCLSGPGRPAPGSTAQIPLHYRRQPSENYAQQYVVKGVGQHPARDPAPKSSQVINLSHDLHLRDMSEGDEGVIRDFGAWQRQRIDFKDPADIQVGDPEYNSETVEVDDDVDEDQPSISPASGTSQVNVEDNQQAIDIRTLSLPDLLSLQLIDGYFEINLPSSSPSWSLTLELLFSIRTIYSENRRGQDVPAELLRRIYSTYLVVFELNRRFGTPTDKLTWSMVEGKARSWIVREVGDNERSKQWVREWCGKLADARISYWEGGE
jgi:hypothetical protein